MPKVSGLVALYPNDCGSLQSLRAECAHHTYFMNSGYINYYINDNFKPFEHRLMAELVFGEIPADYQVHHINRVRSDNRACNLEIIDPSKHAHVHHGTTAFRPTTCAACGATVQVADRRFMRHETFYCNRTCYRLALSSEPDTQTLQDLLNSIRNFTEIGRMYKVSPATVRKWAARRRLDISACNGRKHKVARTRFELVTPP